MTRPVYSPIAGAFVIREEGPPSFIVGFFHSLPQMLVKAAVVGSACVVFFLVVMP